MPVIGEIAAQQFAITLTQNLPFSYGLFDFEYMHQCQGTSESSKKQKLFLMSWCPDTAKVITHRLVICHILIDLLVLTKIFSHSLHF